MSIKIKTDKMKGKNYDYKEAYNKNLTAKARLHYLENARNDQDNSPAKQVGIVDPLAQQQMVAQPVQQMTNVPPQQANTLGQAQPVFNQSVQQAAQGIYGGVDQRQNSVGATPLFQELPLVLKEKPIIKMHQPIKEFKKPVYVPHDRPITPKLQKVYKNKKNVEIIDPIKTVIK